MNLIIFGPPGAGKGTQSASITQKYQLAHISTGDIFRENLKQNTSLGLEAKKFMDEGKLVPDSVVNNMVKDKLEQVGEKFLLDGYPRTINQAEFLDENKIKIDFVLVLEVSDEEVLKRLSLRATCKKCGNVFHEIFSPSKIKDVCDLCAGELYTRDDDKPEVIKKRLETYKKETEQLINYYDKQKKTLKIDGNPPIDMVTAEIFKILNEKVKTLN